MFETTGFVPEEITIVCRPELVFNGAAGPIKVKPAFVVDAKNTNSIAKAVFWGGQNHTKITIPNKPITTIQIVGAETRAGGTVFKAIDDQNNLFDLREDVLLDAMFESGVKKGAKLNGKYIWAQYTNHVRLVKVGSELHKAIERAGKRRTMSKIDSDNLKPGYVYCTKAGKKYIFLGAVQTLLMGYDQNLSDLKKAKYSKYYLIYTGNQYSHTPIQAQFEEALANNSLVHFNLNKTTSFVEKLDKAVMSDDIIDKCRRIALSNAGKNVNSKYLLAIWCGLAHMHKDGDKLPKIPEYVKLLTLA